MICSSQHMRLQLLLCFCGIFVKWLSNAFIAATKTTGQKPLHSCNDVMRVLEERQDSQTGKIFRTSFYVIWWALRSNVSLLDTTRTPSSNYVTCFVAEFIHNKGKRMDETFCRENMAWREAPYSAALPHLQPSRSSVWRVASLRLSSGGKTGMYMSSSSTIVRVTCRAAALHVFGKVRGSDSRTFRR